MQRKNAGETKVWRFWKSATEYQDTRKACLPGLSLGHWWYVIFIARGFHTPRDGSKGELRYVNMYWMQACPFLSLDLIAMYFSLFFRFSLRRCCLLSSNAFGECVNIPDIVLQMHACTKTKSQTLLMT